MKLFEIYKSVITEAEIQSCISKFGYELFGSQFGGSERNTSIENAYADEIDAFTDNMYGEETTPEFKKAIKTLKGCVAQYPEVLIPESTDVFRGITIPAKYFIQKKQLIDLDGIAPYVYKARSPIQSWSIDFKEASSFGNHDTLNEVSSSIDFNDYKTPQARRELLKSMIAEDLRIAFVLKYHTNPDEFMFKSKYFKKLSQAESEEELLRIDNKPIQVEIKFNNNNKLFISDKSLTLLNYINAGIEGK